MVVAFACGAKAPPPAPPPPAASNSVTTTSTATAPEDDGVVPPSPREVCKRVVQMIEADGRTMTDTEKVEALDDCIKDLHEIKNTDEKKYKCASRCIMKNGSYDAAKKCIEGCKLD